ncbi:polysaccharide pyruvyl transferase family protein [Cobetia sp. MMG027]|uniref:polysaccharide pyruvyl transferase family protein n=1 Tax=Cobetia sp. MMG027 TaxID=3021980 RepID=UPI0022FDCAC7|nr:polysaccharide pyruvyl transferase family protein [Cobetia sp. MMG027]MDA5565371.1 polysaccharide pyruvyl transferase family protein [Cobetia sp. MMG027]
MKYLKISALSGVNIGDLTISECITKLVPSFVHIDSIDMNFKKTVFYQSPILRKKKKTDFVKKYPTVYNRLLSINHSLRYKKKIIELAEGYDGLIIGGGNLLFNKNGVNFLEACYKFAKEFRNKDKKIIVLSCGVGPFSCAHFKELNFLVANSQYFSVRDMASLNYLNSILGEAFASKVELLPDPVIPYYKLFPSDKISHKSKKWLGINLIDSVSSPQEALKAQNIDEIVYNLYLLSSNYDLSIKLVTTAYNNDPEFLLKVSNLLHEKYEIDSEVILLNSNDIGSFSNKLSGCKYMLTYRMHLGIISINLGIPTLIVNWQSKISGVVQQFIKNPKLHILDSENFSFDEVTEKFNAIDELGQVMINNDKIIKQYAEIFHE